MARSKLVIACPQCGAANASTVPTCVQCGAPLKPVMTTEPPPQAAPAANSNAANSNIDSADQESVRPGASDELRQFVADAELQRNDRENPNPLSGARLAKLGSQAFVYIGCAILIAIPLALIGLGTLRAMLQKVFQH